jgi:hypothetical protein
VVSEVGSKRARENRDKHGLRCCEIFSHEIIMNCNANSILEPIVVLDRLCGLVVSVADYKHRGPGFDSRALLRIFLRELGLERVSLSLVIG